MDVISFNNEFYLANLQFARIFTGIQLSRKDKSGKNIIVPCVLGTRSRILKSRENPDLASKISLPMIIITRNGFSRDSSRVANLHLEKKLESTSKSKLNVNALTPVPIDINYDVTVLTKYPSDMDEIFCNFLPFFNKDVYTRIDHPKLLTKKLKNQVIWDGSVNETWLDELDPFTPDVQEATLGFTYKTYIFGGTERKDNLGPSIIKVIGLGWKTDIEDLVYKYGDASGNLNILDIPSGAISDDLLNEIALSADENGNVNGLQMINDHPNGVLSAWQSEGGFHDVPHSLTFDQYFAGLADGTLSREYDTFHTVYPFSISAAAYAKPLPIK